MVSVDVFPSLLTFALSGLSIWVLQEKDGDSQPTVLQVSETEAPIWAIILDLGKISILKAWAVKAKREKLTYTGSFSNLLFSVLVSCPKYDLTNPFTKLLWSNCGQPKRIGVTAKEGAEVIFA